MSDNSKRPTARSIAAVVDHNARVADGLVYTVRGLDERVAAQATDINEQQSELTRVDIAREAGDAALDARLRVHRADIQDLYELNSSAAEYATELSARLHAFEFTTLVDRLRWLLTGKVR